MSESYFDDETTRALGPLAFSKKFADRTKNGKNAMTGITPSGTPSRRRIKMKNEPYNSEGYQVEAIDRTHIIRETFSDHIRGHPFVECNAELIALAEKVESALGDLYQAIGRAEVAEANKDA